MFKFGSAVRHAGLQRRLKLRGACNRIVKFVGKAFPCGVLQVQAAGRLLAGLRLLMRGLNAFAGSTDFHQRRSDVLLDGLDLPASGLNPGDEFLRIVHGSGEIRFRPLGPIGQGFDRRAGGPNRLIQLMHPVDRSLGVLIHRPDRRGEFFFTCRQGLDPFFQALHLIPMHADCVLHTGAMPGQDRGRRFALRLQMPFKLFLKLFLTPLDSPFGERRLKP